MPRVLALEPGRQLVGDHVPVEEAHDVERDAEHALVVADGDDRRQPVEPGGADRVLQPRLAHHVVRRGRQRRPRRPAQDEAARSPRSSRNVKFEPPPSPIRVARDRPAAEAVRRRGTPRRARATISGARSPRRIAAMLRRVRRRLYLMRHAEVSYVGEPDPEVVRLTERGHEQAAAAHRALDGRRLRPRRHEHAAANGRDGRGRRAGRRAASAWPEFDEWRGGRLDAVPPEELEQVFVGSLHDPARSTSASSAASRWARRSTASCLRSTASSREPWQTALAVFHGGVNRILISHALAGGRAYFGDVRAGARRASTCSTSATTARWIVRTVNYIPYDPLHPARDDDDGAPLARAAGVAQPRLIATTPPSATADADRCVPVSRSCSSTWASSTVTTG